MTTESALRRRGLSYEIHNVFAFGGILGPTLLARMTRGGPVELIGPGENAHLAEILGALPVDTVLVDGSIDRITQVSSAGDAGFVLVMRVNRINLPRSIEFLRRTVLLQRVPVGGGDLCINGAFTSEAARAIDVNAISVEDITRVFLSFGELVELQKRAKLAVRRRIELRACVMNLFDVSRQQLFDRLADDAIAACIAFNPYQEAA